MGRCSAGAARCGQFCSSPSERSPAAQRGLGSGPGAPLIQTQRRELLLVFVLPAPPALAIPLSLFSLSLALCALSLPRSSGLGTSDEQMGLEGSRMSSVGSYGDGMFKTWNPPPGILELGAFAILESWDLGPMER